MLWAFALAACLDPSGYAVAQDGPHPLKPANTSSPRATLESFVDNMNSMYELLREQDTGADATQTAIFKTRAIRCLDLSKIDPAAVADLGEKRAVMLTEILDRIELPALAEVPDANEARQQKVTRWPRQSWPRRVSIRGASTRKWCESVFAC